jgi:D-xylose 1-dehydrogenase (NADP+, D-xylono-1,5-lactone-forming)
MRDKIKWGILGTAQIAGGAIVPAITASPNGEVAAVASRSADKALEFAETHNIPSAYGSYEELLGDTQIDAVYIPLPISMHAPWAMRCAEAGKPVLCEKPFTLNEAEAREVVACFQEKGLLIAEALMYRYHPLTQTALSLLKSGRIGELRSLHARLHASAPRGGGDIRYRKEMGGGGLLDLGCYCASILRLMAGEEPDVVKAVAEHNDTGVDISLTGALHFPSGITASLECSLGNIFECSYQAVGTKGRLLVERGAMVCWPGEAFKIRIEEAGEEQSEIISTSEADHYQLLVEDFAGALLNARPMAFPIEDTFANMRVLDQLAADVR